jgi:hypothetical protein
MRACSSLLIDQLHCCNFYCTPEYSSSSSILIWYILIYIYRNYTRIDILCIYIYIYIYIPTLLCCVLCAVCCVLCAVCCVLCAVCYSMCYRLNGGAHLNQNKGEPRFSSIFTISCLVYK